MNERRSRQQAHYTQPHTVRNYFCSMTLKLFSMTQCHIISTAMIIIIIFEYILARLVCNGGLGVGRDARQWNNLLSNFFKPCGEPSRAMHTTNISEYCICLLLLLYYEWCMRSRQSERERQTNLLWKGKIEMQKIEYAFAFIVRDISDFIQR